jgi:hypothetical protein
MVVVEAHGVACVDFQGLDALEPAGSVDDSG